MAKQGVDAAQAKADTAEAKWTLLKQPNSEDLASARAEIAKAEETLALTNLLDAGHDIESAQAQVDEAQAEVELVKHLLKELRVLAPREG